MKIQSETRIFVGILIVSLFVAMIASGIEQGQVIGIKAIQQAECCREEGNTPAEVNAMVQMDYFIKVQGGTTNTYTVQHTRVLVPVVYNLTQTLIQTNNAKITAIRQYALENYGFLMPKNQILYIAFDKGS